MSYFKTCPECGANLDPEEKCDCQKKPVEKSKAGISEESLNDLLSLDRKTIEEDK